MVFYVCKAILVCLCAVIILSPWIATAQTSTASDQINKETKSTGQIGSEQEKPPWIKVKREHPQKKTQPQSKAQTQPEKQPDKKKKKN